MSEIDFSAAIQTDNRQAGATVSKPIESMVQVNPFDTAPAKAKFLAYEAAIESMLEKANKHQVVDDKTNMEAVEAATQAKKLFNEIEKLRKALTEDSRKYTTAINNLSKVYTPKLKEIENIFKAQISSYAHKVEMKRREDERKAQEEAARFQEKLNKEAKAKNVEPVRVPKPVLPTKPEPTRTESGSASIRKVWTWKEVDISKVPAEYLMLDRVKINKAVKAGIREIDGIEIYEESQTVLRA